MESVVRTKTWRTGFLLLVGALVFTTGLAVGATETVGRPESYRVEGDLSVAFREENGGRRFSGKFSDVRGELTPQSGLRPGSLKGGIAARVDSWQGGWGREEKALGEVLAARFRFDRFLAIEIQSLWGISGELGLGKISQGLLSAIIRYDGEAYPFETAVRIERKGDDHYVVYPVATVELTNALGAENSIRQAFTKGGWTLGPAAYFTFRLKISREL